MKSLLVLVLDTITVVAVLVLAAVGGLLIMQERGPQLFAIINALTSQGLSLDENFIAPPSPSLNNLAIGASMNETGRELFFSAQPQINLKKEFDADCTVPKSAASVELGCYLAPDKIYLLDLSGSFSNEMTVVAAHEMLHVAYNKLPRSEKIRLETLLEQEVMRINSKELYDLLAHYNNTEPGQRYNELHSIIGTEYDGLSPELELYYSKYFDNRATVVSLSNEFKQTFIVLKRQLEEFRVQINNQKLLLQIFLANNNIDGYNALVPEVNKSISRYNNVINQYEALATQLQQGKDVLEPAQLKP